MAYATLNGRLVKKSKNKVKEPTLIGWYWGYNAKHEGDGFEFTNVHLVDAGLDEETVVKIGTVIKDLCDQQNEMLVNGQFEGCESLLEFLDEEQSRLDWVVEQMKACDYRPQYNDLLQWAMIACCAISSLVRFGRLEQDNFNGDRFMYQVK